MNNTIKTEIFVAKLNELLFDLTGHTFEFFEKQESTKRSPFFESKPLKISSRECGIASLFLKDVSLTISAAHSFNRKSGYFNGTLHLYLIFRYSHPNGNSNSCRTYIEYNSRKVPSRDENGVEFYP